jgi:hypothetical protein
MDPSRSRRPRPARSTQQWDVLGTTLSSSGSRLLAVDRRFGRETKRAVRADLETAMATVALGGAAVTGAERARRRVVRPRHLRMTEERARRPAESELEQSLGRLVGAARPAPGRPSHPVQLSVGASSAASHRSAARRTPSVTILNAKRIGVLAPIRSLTFPIGGRALRALTASRANIAPRFPATSARNRATANHARAVASAVSPCVVATGTATRTSARPVVQAPPSKTPT